MKEFKTKDLINGKHIVECRDGERMFVIDGHLLGVNDAIHSVAVMVYMDEEFVDIENKSRYDIMKVYELKYEFPTVSDLGNILEDESYLNLVWERKEKTAQQIKIEEIENQINDIQKELGIKITYKEMDRLIKKYNELRDELYVMHLTEELKKTIDEVEWE